MREPPEPLLTKAEIARYLRVSTKTVERYMKRGMPYSKPYRNGSVWFRVSEVDGWILDGSQPVQTAADDAPKLLHTERQALMRVRGVVELEGDKLGRRSAARRWLHAHGDEITGALERGHFRGPEVD
jgi:hypothetical protein